MMRPHPASRIPGTVARIRRTAERTSVSKNLRHVSGVVSNQGRASYAPALLIRISIPPKALLASDAAAPSSVAKSPVMGIAWPPAETMRPTTASVRAVSRPCTSTRAPSRANASAIATPIPAEAPVTSVRLPCSFRFIQASATGRCFRQCWEQGFTLDGLVGSSDAPRGSWPSRRFRSLLAAWLFWRIPGRPRGRKAYAARSDWNHYLYRRHRVAARQRWVRQSRCSEIWLARSFPVHGAGTRPKRDSHCSCDQVGARICNGLGIMRACLETQKLEQLEARMAEIADRVGRDRTNAARERTSTHETQRLSN